MMKLGNAITGAVLMTLAAGSAIASGPVEVVDGDLVVYLGNATSNRSTRTILLQPGDNPDEVSYVYFDESGVETLGTVKGFGGVDGNVNILSNTGKDTITLLGLQVNNLTINTGNGNDEIYLNLVDTNGALDVRSGRGKDNVMLINQVVEGSASIWTQGGADTLSILSGFFDGSVAVRTGGGADNVTVSYAGFGGGRPLFNGQGGNDTFADGGGNGFYSGAPRIVRFEDIVDESEPTTFAIGDVGPGGGIVFQVNDDGTGLEVSPGVVAASLAYGCSGDQLVDLPANDPARLDITGEQNSVLLANANVADICSSPAAEATFAFTIEGLSDDGGWYLPSANELVTLLTTLSTEQLSREGGAAGYWSSSEDTDDNAYIVFDTDPADISPNAKTTPAAVLAIRNF